MMGTKEENLFSRHITELEKSTLSEKEKESVAHAMGIAFDAVVVMLEGLSEDASDLFCRFLAEEIADVRKRPRRRRRRS